MSLEMSTLPMGLTGSGSTSRPGNSGGTTVYDRNRGRPFPVPNPLPREKLAQWKTSPGRRLSTVSRVGLHPLL